jgi:hypothetical protein
MKSWQGLPFLRLPDSPTEALGQRRRAAPLNLVLADAVACSRPPESCVAFENAVRTSH